MREDMGASLSATGLGAPKGAEPSGLGASPAIPSATPWWAGDNDEFYHIGPCKTRTEALGEALSFFGIDRDIHLLQAQIADWHPPSAASVIDMMVDNSDELFFDDGFPGMAGTKEAVSEAEAELDGLLAVWLGKWRNIFPTPNAFGRFGEHEVVPALAAGSGTAETRETAAQCEASQSGGDSRNAQPQPPSRTNP